MLGVGDWEGEWEGTWWREIGTGGQINAGTLHIQNSIMNNIVIHNSLIKILKKC